MAKESKSSASKPAVKKTTTKSKSASASKPRAPRKAPAKSAVKKATTKSRSKTKKPAQVVGGGIPMVDTNFAAESAARMLANRAKLGRSPVQKAIPPTTDAQRESGAFKQMKESINKPAAGGMAAAMGNTFGPDKTNLPNPDRGQVVRDQTTSSVNRINVPRRTGG